MSINCEKLRQLWKNREQVLARETEIQKRAELIFGILDRWALDRDSVLAIGDYGKPSDKEIPTDSWNGVKSRLNDFYASQPELKSFVRQVEDVSEFLHLQNRDQRFRLSSDAGRDSQYETTALHPNRRNPEAHFASYNFPFEIIKFLFSCKTQASLFTLNLPFEGRYIPKYIWMVANSDKVLPILSLQSFRELSSLFRELMRSVDWGDGGGRWALPLGEFIAAWPEVSNRLCRSITDQNYSNLPEKEKRALAALLFVASVCQTTTKNAFDMIRTGNQAMILYGPPGTGKTYYAKEVVKELLKQPQQGDGTEALETPAPANDEEACRFTKTFGTSSPVKPGSVSHGCWEIVQFHPSYSYQDFIGGIMPNVEGNELCYTNSEGIFKRFCDAARGNPKHPFVLIIDEINRADLSSVFGELMYGLEYRDQPVSTIHFGQFSIPKNVYIVGTMNTTDKSLVTFDLALRRRFLFMKLGPDLNALHSWNAGDGAPFPEQELNSFISRAESLNRALVAPDGLGLPEDYAIGQAYFMKIRDFCPAEDGDTRHISEFACERLWDYHLEPLIEEYLGAETKAFRPQIADLRKQFTTQAQTPD
jgi:Cdc6-like AAA superfamily ATPase